MLWVDQIDLISVVTGVLKQLGWCLYGAFFCRAENFFVRAILLACSKGSVEASR